MVFLYKFRARFGFRIVPFDSGRKTLKEKNHIRLYSTNQPHVQ